jgi:two-component system CheB/CheR fusion protein
MKNLLNSTDIATLFLDKELNIRRFTNQATKIFKLIKSDIGRPFTDQVSDLIYPGLASDALEVLRTLVFIQKQIPARDGRWFFIRIMPYRTLDDRIEGLVITFVNISDLKKVEVKLHETEQKKRFLVNSSSDVIIELSTDLKILEFSPVAEKYFGKTHDEAVNQNYVQMFVPELVRKKTEKDLNNMLNKLQGGKFKMQLLATGCNMTEVEGTASVLKNGLNMATGIILTLKR